MDFTIVGLLLHNESAALSPRDMIRLCSVDRTTRRLFLGDKHADLIQHLAVRAKCQPKRVMAVLRQYRCRECLRYSRAHARTLSGRTVIVCVTCSRKPDAYSTLWDHKTALRAYDAHVGWKVRKRVWLESLLLARLGGYRARLYWRHQIVDTLHSSESR